MENRENGRRQRLIKEKGKGEMQMQMRPKYNKPHLKRKKERERVEENSKFKIPNWSEWKEPTIVWVEKYSKAVSLWSEEWKKREKERQKRV